MIMNDKIVIIVSLHLDLDQMLLWHSYGARIAFGEA